METSAALVTAKMIIHSATPRSSFYVVVGTLRRDAPCYIQRQADHDLYDALMEGKFYYVLTPRQMGKSSLITQPVAEVYDSHPGRGSASLPHATGCRDSQVRLWEVATGKLIAALTGHTGSVSSVAFSPDRTLLASGGSDRIIEGWDLASLKVRQSLVGHANIVSGIAFSPGGNTIASAGWDRVVKLWDLATGKELMTFTAHSSPLLHFTPPFPSHHLAPRMAIVYK